MFMKLKLFVLTLVTIFNQLSVAEVFSVEEQQYNQKTYLTVREAVSNALADEDLMNEIMKAAHGELINQLYELNASNQIPEKLLSQASIDQFTLRQEELKKITNTLNAQIKKARLLQDGEGMQAADFVPDAIYLYYPLIQASGRLAVLSQVAAVATWVNKKTYEVPNNDICKSLTTEQIEVYLDTNVMALPGCELKLVDVSSGPDVSMFAMVGADKKFFSKASGPSRKRAGIGLIWDTSNQFSSARDIAGMGASASLGPLLKPIQMGLGRAWHAVKNIGKKPTQVVIKKRGGMGISATEAATETVTLNVPTQFDAAAMYAAFKSLNNFRIGGIYSSYETFNGIPDYVTVSFDLDQESLKSVFGLNFSETTSAGNPPKSSSGLKAATFAFIPVVSIVSFLADITGLDELDKEYKAAEQKVFGKD